MQDRLTKLAILYGTDKFGYHDYTPNYFKMFQHLQDAPVKVLEIGVGGYADDDRGGQSLEIWRDFFRNGEITGIDIQKKTMDLGERVAILQGSQVDADFLNDLVKQRGPFDIIIDDGSHRNEHVVESFKLLFPSLAPGGIYVAEDVQTSFHPRFGGSLELTAPNSIGYFGDMQRHLNGTGKALLIKDIAAMERFHNMIAIHKKTGGQAGDVFQSNRFEDFRDLAPQVHCIGGVPELPFETASVSESQDMANPPAADILILTLDGASDFDPATVESLFDNVNDPGVMVIRSTDPAKDFAPDGPLMEYAQKRWTLVDHVEMLVHFPQAEVDALAAQIYSIERFSDAILLHKSPNTYPSNFAYDPHNAQAARAISRMEDVLQGATSEGGLVQLADILTRHKSREAAADTIARLTEIGATSRQYYQMAGALAQREKRLPEALEIFKTALEKFPHDPQFTCMLAGTYGALRQGDMAEATLRGTLAENPRARAVIGALTKLLIGKREYAEASELIKSSVTLFPVPMRPARLVMLSEVQRAEGDIEAAEATMKDALERAPDAADVLLEMGQVLLVKGDQDGARSFAEKALERGPDNVKAQAFHQQISG
jgi:demethylmacrocin O-methyltransferase